MTDKRKMTAADRARTLRILRDAAYPVVAGIYAAYNQSLAKGASK
jgi:hypothetical protein